MLNYQSGIQNTPPQAPQWRPAAALSGLLQPGGANQQEVIGALDSVNAANYAVAADRAKSDYALAQREAQDQTALRGMETMLNDRKAKQSLENQMLQGYFGAVSPIFSALMK